MKRCVACWVVSFREDRKYAYLSGDKSTTHYAGLLYAAHFMSKTSNPPLCISCWQSYYNFRYPYVPALWLRIISEEALLVYWKMHETPPIKMSHAYAMRSDIRINDIVDLVDRELCRLRSRKIKDLRIIQFYTEDIRLREAIKRGSASTADLLRRMKGR